MRDAWRRFKSGEAETFSEALKGAWRLAKIQECMAAVTTRKLRTETARPAKKAEPYRWADGITADGIYRSGSKGYMGSAYCGD